MNDRRGFRLSLAIFVARRSQRFGYASGNRYETRNDINPLFRLEIGIANRKLAFVGERLSSHRRWSRRNRTLLTDGLSCSIYTFLQNPICFVRA